MFSHIVVESCPYEGKYGLDKTFTLAYFAQVLSYEILAGLIQI